MTDAVVATLTNAKFVRQIAAWTNASGTRLDSLAAVSALLV